jgi:hypothetical protein
MSDKPTAEDLATIRRLIDECYELAQKQKEIEADLKIKKSTLATYLEAFDMDTESGEKAVAKVTTTRRFKCWEDNKAKILELPKEKRTELAVPDYQAIKAEVKAGLLPNSILDGALFSESSSLRISVRKD